MTKEYVDVGLVAEWDTDTSKLEWRCRTPTRRVGMERAATPMREGDDLKDWNIDEVREEIVAFLGARP